MKQKQTKQLYVGAHGTCILLIPLFCPDSDRDRISLVAINDAVMILEFIIAIAFGEEYISTTERSGPCAAHLPCPAAVCYRLDTKIDIYIYIYIYDSNAPPSYPNVFASTYLNRHNIPEKHQRQSICTTCRDEVEDSKAHRRENYILDDLLCTWSGCYVVLESDSEIQSYVRTVHEMRVRVCSDVACLKIFQELEDANTYWQVYWQSRR